VHLPLVLDDSVGAEAGDGRVQVSGVALRAMKRTIADGGVIAHLEKCDATNGLAALTSAGAAALDSRHQAARNWISNANS